MSDIQLSWYFVMTMAILVGVLVFMLWAIVLLPVYWEIREAIQARRRNARAWHHTMARMAYLDLKEKERNEDTDT